MLARRLTTIVPAMSLAEALETTRIHSVAGLTGDLRRVYDRLSSFSVNLRIDHLVINWRVFPWVDRPSFPQVTYS
jgi:hypothetical protein